MILDNYGKQQRRQIGFVRAMVSVEEPRADVSITATGFELSIDSEPEEVAQNDSDR